ncbi:uncharacterized protein LOC120413502 isoform X1 [Culex pipiens pallens]|uniref:uncharacterized protein LOC120413502 isoform X1 n=2 Tax=Culex pipiens pallens TaxID=42434 RepID=UPI0019532E8E|nr:uncharacterized protein LOC120413502 isoform X1 [Culex pipiens pallens]
MKSSNLSMSSLTVILYLAAVLDSSVPLRLNDLAFPQDDLQEAVKSILSEYFVSNHSAVIVLRSARTGFDLEQLHSDILDRVMAQTSTSIAFMFPTTTSGLSQRPCFYNLLLIDGYLAFQTVIKQIDPDRNEFGGRFLFVMTSADRVEKVTLHSMFSTLWSNNIVNVLVITKQYGEILMYSYFPYSADHCEYTEPVLVDRWDSGWDNINLFPNKLENLYGCPMRIASFDYPPFTMIARNSCSGELRLIGYEGFLIDTIARKFNFSVELVVPEGNPQWGVIENNTALSGAFKMIVNLEVNLSVGGYSVREERVALMEPSVTYHVVSLMLAVPPGRPYTAFEKLFRPFTLITWLMIALYLLLGCLCIVVLRFYPNSIRNFTYGRRTGSPLINMLNSFFGGALVRTPARNFARTLLFMWMYYSFVMRSLYTGSLYEFLQQNKTFSHISSIEHLESEGIPYLISDTFKAFLTAYPQVLRRTQPLEDNPPAEIFHNLKRGRLNAAVLATHDYIAWYNERYFREGVVHLADDVLLQQPICLYFPKRNCLTHPVNLQIENIKVSGLLGYWMHQYVGYRFYKRTKRTQKARNHQHSPKVLTNEHLAGCYQALVWLLALSAGIFALELASTRFHWLRMVFERIE